MAKFPVGLSHVAMSVPAGSLTAEYRAEVCEFYGAFLHWTELEELALPDRLTLAVGRHSYVNIREQAEPMVCNGYEHLGIVVGSSDDADRLWADLRGDDRDVNLEPLTSKDDGYRSFRFRYLLPLAVEIQYFP